MTKTVPSQNLTTGRVLNSAPNPGNAEVQECVKEVDGAQDTMDAKELHSQTKLQALPPIAESVLPTHVGTDHGFL